MPKTSMDPNTPAVPKETAAPAKSATAEPGVTPTSDAEAMKAQARHKDEMAGTRMLPTPDDAPTVAGMPRQGRSLAEPGDPGNISPADDVYANDPADLSQKR